MGVGICVEFSVHIIHVGVAVLSSFLSYMYVMLVLVLLTYTSGGGEE